MIEAIRHRGNPSLPKEEQTPGADEGQTPGVDEGQTPGADEGQTPGADEGQTPGADEGQTPGADEGQTPGADDPAHVSAEAAWVDGGATEPAELETSPAQPTVEGRGARRATSPRVAVDCSIRIGGLEYTLVPTVGDVGPSASESRGRVPAASAASKVAAKRVRAARKEAGLTQAELAERLGQSQSTVSQAESGAARIGKRYVERVIRACELEPDWGLPAVEAEPAISGWELEPGEIAGLDPETLEPVKRGSPRDLELSRSFVWWSNRPEI